MVELAEKQDYLVDSRLVLVESDPDTVNSLKRALVRAPIAIEMHTEPDERKALSYLDMMLSGQEKADEISLILLGPNISVPSGQKFFESLRNNDRCRHLPVAVLAASAYDEVVQRAYKNSANYIISKVDTLEGVMNTVDMIVRFWFQATHETYMK